MAEKKNWPSVGTWVGADGRQLIFELRDAYGQVIDLQVYTVTLRAVLDGTVVLDWVVLDKFDSTNGLCRLIHGFVTDGDYDAQIRMANAVGDLDYTEEFSIVVRKVVGS